MLVLYIFNFSLTYVFYKMYCGVHVILIEWTGFLAV